MKKFLSLIGAFSLIVTAGSTIVGCGTSQSQLEGTYTTFTNVAPRIRGAKYLKPEGVPFAEADILLDYEDDAYFIKLLKYMAAVNTMAQVPEYKKALQDQKDFDQKNQKVTNELPSTNLVVYEWHTEHNTFIAYLDDAKWHGNLIPDDEVRVTYTYRLKITQDLWDAFHHLVEDDNSSSKVA